MRLAIISDIHGNLEALTSALALIDKQSVDEIVCLGDVVGYGASPNECIDMVRQRCQVILLGNHDAAALDLNIAEQFTLNARLSAQWTYENLLPDNKQFLKQLLLTKTIGEILLVHASPYDPEEWHYIFNYFEAKEAFRSFTERICFIGHSHVPLILSEEGEIRHVKKEGRYIVNVGSIGQPRDGNPLLSYGLFDTEAWEYTNVRAEYDKYKAAHKVREAGLPRVLADRLFLGI